MRTAESLTERVTNRQDMIDPKTLDELVRRCIKALPDDLGQLSDEFGQNVKAAFSVALSRADLVTREEFDVQSAVLTRTREKLIQLEETVKELETRLGNQASENASA